MRHRYARVTDIPVIMTIIGQAKRRLNGLGVDQWQDGYPDEAAIRKDIQNKNGHVFTKEGEVVAYAAAVFDRDPYYEHIDGRWLTDNPYVVVHRIAVHDRHTHQGVATDIMKAVERMAVKKGVPSFRIDTHHDNHYMRNMIRSVGFTLCGIVQVRDGIRLAYEKILK